VAGGDQHLVLRPANRFSAPGEGLQNLFRPPSSSSVRPVFGLVGLPSRSPLRIPPTCEPAEFPPGDHPAPVRRIAPPPHDGNTFAVFRPPRPMTRPRPPAALPPPFLPGASATACGRAAKGDAWRPATSRRFGPGKRGRRNNLARRSHSAEIRGWAVRSLPPARPGQPPAGVLEKKRTRAPMVPAGEKSDTTPILCQSNLARKTSSPLGKRGGGGRKRG